MESRTLSILPTSIDTQRAYYTIQGSFKYLTKKIRLSDFSVVNGQQYPRAPWIDLPILLASSPVRNIRI